MPDNPRIEELRRRVHADPTSIAFAALAEEYRRTGNYAEAIETCRIGLQRHPSYLSARVTLGRALMETAQYEEARTQLELVLKSAPENLAAIRGLAEIHERQRSLPEPDAIAPAPVARPAPAASPSLAMASPATTAIVEKPVEAAAAAEWAMPSTVPEPAVRQAPGIVVTPVNAATYDLPAEAGNHANPKVESHEHPAIAGLEQLLAAIQAARASSRIAR